jgi:alanine-glyoxylate transaminase / serine-glyoxylate transaminase / serine-pyruvate transaminase
MFHPGWHFLQIPGPTNVPDRVLRAMARPTIDHRGPEFSALTLELVAGLQRVFNTSEPVVIYPGSGSAAIEAAYVNTLSPGDRILVFETGAFSLHWKNIADRLGLRADYVPGDWRSGASDVELESRLGADKAHEIKAVVVVHNETSTGVASRLPDLRKAMDRAKHPALLIVDAVSSLASMPYRHDEWGVDVTVCGSQKGLMVPPGLGFCAVSKKARAAGKDAKLPRAYFDWNDIITQNAKGFFPYTPATNLFYALREAIQMLEEEGMENVLRRHARHGEATRAAVRAWGLEIVCADPREYSNSMTAVFMPDGHNADNLRSVILEHFNMPLGIGLAKLSGKVFRIGHLGNFNDLMLAGTLSGVEMGMRVAGVPHREGGVLAALKSLCPVAEPAHAR